MKKILISVLIILLLVLSYFALAKGIGFLKIKSINDIKNASSKLESDFNQANELSSKTYPSEVEALENAIKQLKISKQEYENKNIYNTDENLFGAIEIKTYRIHYLWTILGNYRKNRGVQSLTLDLKSTETKDVYDLEFKLIGKYTNITDFIYDIENDEELNFDIKNTKIEPYTTKTTTTVINGDDNSKTINEDSPYNTITGIIEENSVYVYDDNEKLQEQNDENKKEIIIYDPELVQASFRVDNIGITLD